MKDHSAHGVMFHHFSRENRGNALGAITPNQFEDLVLWYGPTSILPAGEWLERATNNSLQAGQVCLTFDDALRSQIELALPVLKKYGLTAFWFIYSSVFEGQGHTFEVYRHFYNTYYPSFDHFFAAFLKYIKSIETAGRVADARQVFSESDYLKEYPFYSHNEREYRFFRDRVLGREKFEPLMEKMIVDRGLTIGDLTSGLWMGNDDLSSLAQSGHIVGLHSYTHPTELSSLSYVDQLQEYEKNAQHITKVTGRRPESVAHPVNSYGSETLKILSDMDVKLGFRSNMEKLNYGPLEHPREDCANICSTKKEINQPMDCS